MNTYLKAKVSAIKITAARREYEGSLTLDSEIMAFLGVEPYEQVYVNSKYGDGRIMTYVLQGDEGVCELNGGACSHFEVGEVVHLLFFAVKDYPIQPVIYDLPAE